MTDTRDDSQFECAKCKHRYEGLACPQCGLLARPRCPACGSRLYFDQARVFCPTCGEPLGEGSFFQRKS